MHNDSHRINAIKGVAWALLGTFAFSFVTASGKYVGVHIPVLQIVFLRYLGGFIASVIIAFSNGSGLASFKTPVLPRHFSRAVSGATGVVCSLYAATHMPLAEASAIGLTQGMFVVLFATLLLGEFIDISRILAILVCAMGAFIIVLGNFTEVRPNLAHAIPAAAALSGAFLVALEIFLIKTLSTAEPPLTILIYVNLFGALLLAVPAAFLWRPLLPVEYLWLPLLGPLAILAQYCNLRGYKIADASLLAPVGYSRLIFAAIIGVIVFHELPPWTTVLGGLTVALGGILLARLHVVKPARV